MRLIDADALWMDVIHSMDYCDDILEFIERQPTIEPERKKGRWIPQEGEDGEPYGDKCSECGARYVMPEGKTNYCPVCGAWMEGTDETD